MCNSRLFSHRSGKDYCDLYTLRRAAICGVGVACLPALLAANPWLVRGEHPADLERGRIARRLAARADDPK
jgi:hypothetical protein